MPFEITSVLDGTDKMITAQELIKRFRLPIDPEGNGVVFELSKNQFSKSLYSDKQTASSRNIKTLINGSFEGVSYVIRYFESKVFKPPFGNQGGYHVYSPRAVNFKGHSNFAPFPDRLELATFLMLSKRCAVSPFANRNSVPMYEVVDRAARAKKIIDAEMATADVRVKILQLSDQDAIRYAKGISFDGYKISTMQTNTGLEAKAALLGLIARFPAQLYEALNSEETYNRGVVQEHIDDSRLVLKEAAAGIGIWQLNGKEVLRVAADKDRFQAIFDHYDDPSPLLKVETKEAPLDIIRRASEAGVIAFDPTDKKVRLMEDGVAGRSVGTVKTNSRWMEELVDVITPIALGAIKKKM